MRILLDECVDERNGALLLAAESAAFDVLMTVDQNIPDQQTLTDRRITVLILCDRTNRLSDLNPLVPAARDALVSMRPGQVVRVRE